MEETLQPVNPFLEKYLAIRHNPDGAQVNTSTIKHPQSAILREAGLDNVDCEKCDNTGQIPWMDENQIMHCRECECMKRRRSIRRLENSGLKKMVQKYSFDNYQTPNAEYIKIKAKAKEFVHTPAEWFFICGKPGSGKTHVCTAICSSLLDAGWSLRYFLWRTDAAELKAMNTEREAYKKAMNKLRNAPVLYVDDLFKGSISEGDVNLAFSILNDRYNSSGKKTIISTELTINEISKIDDAIAGRIVERSKGFFLKAPDVNWRQLS